MERNQSDLRVGLAVGQGTGPELADVFTRVVNLIAQRYQIRIKLNRSSRIYHSYHSLFSVGNGHETICRNTAQDALHYEEFCKRQFALGTRVIFRTAFTAQSLYLVREHLEAIKVETFSNTEANVILVRDQAQGFYTGSNEYVAEKGAVSRICKFDKEVTNRILRYSLGRARKAWGKDIAIGSVTMVYKHHLFDGVMDAWATEWTHTYGVKIQYVQPDTMNRNLLRSGFKGYSLIIAGSEYADIMEVVFLDWFKQGVQETTYSENVYLSPMVYGLAEYQTVHGSADDLTNKGIVNPTATIRAAAAILENIGCCSGAKDAMDHAIDISARQNAVTVDQGGDTSTAKFVDAVLDRFSERPTTLKQQLQPLPALAQWPESPNRARADMGMKTAIVVMDLQNDFLTSAVREDRTLIKDLTPNISQLLHFARAEQQQYEVIFVRFLCEEKTLPSNWAYRNKILDRHMQCLSGTPGAEFIASIKPESGEQVFDKQAVFDAFLCDAFASYLTGRGFKHLVISGLFGDICVDSTARTAFQKGFYLTIIEDCVCTLHLPLCDWLDFAKQVYGARIVTSAEFLGMGTPRVKAKLS